MRPRVAWVLKELGLGGAERLLLEMAPHLALHVEFKLISIGIGPTDLSEAYRSAGLPPTTLGGAHVADARWLLRLRQRVTEDRIDLVHLHGPYTGALGRLALGRFPMVYTEHNVWESYHPLSRWANAITFPLNDMVVPVSRGVERSILRSRVGRRMHGRLRVVPNGIDVAAARADAESIPNPLGKSDGGPAYGVVGHLRFRKGIDVLLRAATRIQQEVPEARAVVVGSGEDDAALTAIREQIGASSVHFMGQRSDARAIIRGLDVFVIPSRAEGLPVALLEAMALETPVVATEVGGIPDVLVNGQDALLVPPEDPDALAAAILRLLRDDDLGRRLAISARTKVEEHYSAEAMANAYLEIYQQVLTRRAAR